jgi:hypothetical protein
MAAILRFMTLTDVWAQAGSNIYHGGRRAARPDATHLRAASTARRLPCINRGGWTAPGTLGNARKTKGCARQPREMPMPRSCNAERVSNRFDLPTDVGYDRFRGVLAPKAAIGRLNIVSTPG